MTDAGRYPAQVFWSNEDEGYIATAPDLSGCSAFGKTQQEALAELQSAIAAWIEATRAAGNPIPEPSGPDIGASYSGKTVVRMPKSLHAQIAKQAKREDVSLNQYMVFLLTWATTQTSVNQSVSKSSYREDLVRVWSKLSYLQQETDKALIIVDFRPVRPMEGAYVEPMKKAVMLTS